MAKSELFYASNIPWEEWCFVLLSSEMGIRLIDLHGTSLSEIGERLGVEIVQGGTKTAAVNQNLVCQEIEEYLNGDRMAFSSSLDMQGTPFQIEVWNELLNIPYGETCSYGEIAAAIGRPRAARAVGAAIGANPLPLIVPCHRVIGKNGSLVGFGGGLRLKERLLLLEKMAQSKKPS
ncbi:MAG: methylated-DNA--[protein]-cysteine S-methyltransferase [Candidatus Bipolaricaulota bacterium]|nr:methylated-DNA--[protein]-cysteine S-methyltransferase [Candidatus Bipolaricaulota bacterium]